VATITRHRQIGGKGILDCFSDGRCYAYWKGDRATEAIIKIEEDDTTSIINFMSPDFAEIEEPSANPDISLDGLHVMDETKLHIWRVTIWFEFFWWPQIATVWQSTLTETTECQIQILKGAMDAWYTDPSLSLALATNLVNNSIKPKYTEVGISDIPELFIRLATEQ